MTNHIYEKYVLATANPGKINEMQLLLSGLGIEAVTRCDLGIDIEIEETGTTFLENATLKAKKICSLSGMPAIADDSGLIVDSLGGRPGVYSSTFGGEGLTSTERCRYLLNEIIKSGIAGKTEQRSAKFVCTIVCIFPDGYMLTATGECRGEITKELCGSGGFGYDPVFLPGGFEKTMAELSTFDKNKISHRGKALRCFVDLLKIYNEVKMSPSSKASQTRLYEDESGGTI